MKTFSPKAKDLTRRWYLLDAAEMPLGRLATAAARLLMGKDKVTVAPHLDGGDFVVVLNAKEIVTTGAKNQQKFYWRHSGFPGGLRRRSLNDQLATDPKKIIEHAIAGMLPANKLRPQRLKRLKIYIDDQHQHHAQAPIKLTEKK